MKWYEIALIGSVIYLLLDKNRLTRKTRKKVLHNPYFLRIGQKEEDWIDPSIKKFNGHYHDVQNLPLKSLADAHSVASMIDADSYSIEYSDSLDGYDGKPIFKTKDILSYDAAKSMETRESDSRALARMDALNKTRRVIVLCTGSNYLIYALRSYAKIKKPRTITMYSHLLLKARGYRPIDISPGRYYLDGYERGFQRLKLMRDISYSLGMTNYNANRFEDFSQIVREIAKEYPVIVQEYHKLLRGKWSTQIE